MIRLSTMRRTPKRAPHRASTRINRVTVPPSTDLFGFRQLVAAGGYKVISDRRQPGALPEAMLTDMQQLPPGMLGYGGHQELGTSYRPFVDRPALFREFAAIPDSQDACLRFANEHGLLGAERLELVAR